MLGQSRHATKKCGAGFDSFLTTEAQRIEISLFIAFESQMPLTPLDSLAHGAIAVDIAQARASLWILPGVDHATLSGLARLYWANVWNFERSIDFAALWRSLNTEREPFVICDPDADTESFHVGSYVRVYQATATNSKKPSLVLERLKAEQLKLRATHIGGSLFVAGDVQRNWEDIDLITEIAPQLRICIVPIPLSTHLVQNETPGELYLWSASFNEFTNAFNSAAATSADANIIDLKDANDLKIPQRLLDELGADWMLLTRREVRASTIDQEAFDRFLIGEPAWAIYAAQGAYLRNLRIHAGKTSPTHREASFPGELLSIIRELDENEIDPREAFRQLILFCEPGSGVTTFMRQLAVATAQAGYPTFLSKPLPKNLTVRSLGRVIGAVQDLWSEHRRGRGSGVGQISAVIFIDKDAEDVADFKVLAKSLSAVSRKVVLVRALERTRDEMAEADGVYLMPSDIDEAELLALGRHLREFAERYSLAPIPGVREWLAYHQGLNQISRYSPGPQRTVMENLPHLFLIGIHPFISERIKDINSLEQYYFQRWDSISSANVKAIVHSIAAAGAFTLSVPYNALRRHTELDLSELETPHSKTHRTIETFIEWRHEGTNLQNWYLRVRHPLVAFLLCRSIDPIEGEVPFRPLLSVLARLTTKPDDLWFAETLAFRIGQHFTTKSPGFSLETDTSMQKAARAIFSAIPQPLKDVSRPITHHEARYHIHVIHACLTALKEPGSTTLLPEQIHTVLDAEVSRSCEWLDRALKIHATNEPDSNIFNTYARLKFAYAASFNTRNGERFRNIFEEGLDLQERAIEGDATNGYALYQFVQQIIETVPTASDSWTSDQQLQLLSRAEARLAELLRLHQEKRWRNIDPVDAEVQIGTLLANHINAISRLPNLTDVLSRFHIEHPEAALRIRIRLYVGSDTIENVFRNDATANDLRNLRDALLRVSNKTPRGLLYLYRLFIADPQGRVAFKARLDLLTELKRKSPEQFLPYWHDEAALLCQLDNLAFGAQRFAELRSFRRADESQWFWLNERLLLSHDGRPRPRLMTLIVAKHDEGWATFQNTNIRLRYQPQQFAAMSRNQPFKAYIRFTIYGLQAVPEQMAQQDFRAMSL